MITIFTNILKFLTDPKNTRMLMLGAIVVFLLLFLQQCGATRAAKAETELQKQETVRVSNNYEAAMDTIEQGKVDENTWRAEKAGYQLTLKEAEEKYADVLDDLQDEKNKPPKVVIKTVFKNKEDIDNVTINSTDLDSNGNGMLTFADTAQFDSTNYRYLGGRIPYKFVFDVIDSTYKMIPDFGTFELEQGMNLNVGLFQDDKTKKISIVATTDYPGITFTKLEGADIMADKSKENRKLLRQMRKPWGLGINIGYGFVVDYASGTMATGPFVGIGLSYTPKFLQWGR